MIQQTFLILPGIRHKRERSLWQQGITNWDDFLVRDSVKGVSQTRKLFYDQQLRNAKAALFNSDASYFSSLLSVSEQWRLYSWFTEDALFLDIETTGKRKNELAVVGLYDGFSTKLMIKDVNLDLIRLQQEIDRAKLLVTFNGSCFDVPFLQKYGLCFDKLAHFDVRFACQRLQLTGGLKHVEKTLGIARESAVGDLHGGDPSLLWRMYRNSGDRHYLDLLVMYNEEDLINLRIVADKTVTLLQKQLTQQTKQ